MTDIPCRRTDNWYAIVMVRTGATILTTRSFTEAADAWTPGTMYGTGVSPQAAEANARGKCNGATI